ncbi:MAG TPA: GDYXXLXY domain-containing protein [Gemmatimonadales bacterium]|nr:GDYXXLXY domain-containing protein [Gemmatimonadales bacterium]
MTRLKLAAVCVGLQLLFFAGWAGREQARLASGASILVKVVPVDPRDLLRGQYLRLAYEFSRPWDSTVRRINVPVGAPVWVVLRREGAFHVPERLLLARPALLDSDAVAIRGRSSGQFGSWFEFGVEQYFVHEGVDTPAASDLTVRLRVTPSGIARIQQVYVKGVPWP